MKCLAVLVYPEVHLFQYSFFQACSVQVMLYQWNNQGCNKNLSKKKSCSTITYNDLSCFLFFKGQKTEAERYYLRAIQLDPTKGNCYMHYGKKYIKRFIQRHIKQSLFKNRYSNYKTMNAFIFRSVCLQLTDSFEVILATIQFEVFLYQLNHAWLPVL